MITYMGQLLKQVGTFSLHCCDVDMKKFHIFTYFFILELQPQLNLPHT